MLQTNSKYLSNAINQNYQKNFSEYVNTWRVKDAMEMFKEREENGKFTIQSPKMLVLRAERRFILLLNGWWVLRRWNI